jgi:hypothetical protein
MLPDTKTARVSLYFTDPVTAEIAAEGTFTRMFGGATLSPGNTGFWKGSDGETVRDTITILSVDIPEADLEFEWTFIRGYAEGIAFVNGQTSMYVTVSDSAGFRAVEVPALT